MNQVQYSIRNFEVKDIEAVKLLADQEIGQNYYSISELKTIQNQSVKASVNCSFVLTIRGEIKAFRLSYPPGNWSNGKGKGLSLDQLPYSLTEIGYFQSLFVHKDYQRQGFGRKLSDQSITALKKLGTKGILCHSWKQSPANSSQRYLVSMGFEYIAEHPDYWINVDYTCPRCGKPCHCTAQEMFLDLSKRS